MQLINTKQKKFYWGVIINNFMKGMLKKGLIERIYGGLKYELDHDFKIMFLNNINTINALTQEEFEFYILNIDYLALLLDIEIIDYEK